MSSRICTPSGSHIYGNGNLGIELNDGGLCGIQSTECSHMHPYKSNETEVKTGDRRRLAHHVRSVLHVGMSLRWHRNSKVQ
jgi:hypothetical protein